MFDFENMGKNTSEYTTKSTFNVNVQNVKKALPKLNNITATK